MSFLREPRVNRQAGAAPSRRVGGPLTAARGGAPMVRPSLVGRSQGQSQLLLSRPQTAAATTTMTSNNNQTSVSQRTQTGTRQSTRAPECDQSMADVYKDLRVLEEQQKESQRKLDITRQTKQHRLQERLDLEKSLEKCKYSNGERRVQLGRFRDLLASTDRKLGLRRIIEDKASNNLRDFDKMLKRGLDAARINNELKRKIEAMMLYSIRKGEQWTKTLEKCSEQSRKLETERDDAKRTLESLRQQVHAEVVKARDYSEKVTATRSELSVLEQDLSKAQQNEASTKLHVENLDQDITTEKQKNAEELEKMRQQIQANKQAKASSDAHAVEAQAAITKAQKQMQDLQAQMAGIQESEGRAVAVDADPATVFDLSLISESLAKEEKKFNAATTEKQQLSESIESSKKEEAQLLNQETTLQTQTNDIVKATTTAKETQLERRKAMDKQLEELDTATKELARLHQSYSELSASNVNQRNTASGRADALKLNLENKRQEFSTLVSTLEDKISGIETLQEESVRSKQKHDTKMSELNRLHEEAQAKLTKVRDTLKAAKSSEEEYKALNKERDAVVETMKVVQASVDSLLNKYKDLKSVKFSYDPKATVDEQAEILLEDLTKAGEARVKAAKEESIIAKRELRKTKQQQQKAEAKRQRKEQAERARKEAEARKVQEEEDRKKKEETERKIMEVAENRKRKEEEATKAREQEERKLTEREERKMREAAAERKRKEEEELNKARELEEHKRKEREERKKKEREEREDRKRKEKQQQKAQQREEPQRMEEEKAVLDKTEKVASPDKEMLLTDVLLSSSQKRVHWQDVSDDDESIDSPPPAPTMLEDSDKKSSKTVRRQFGSKARESISSTTTLKQRSAGKDSSKSPSSSLGKLARDHNSTSKGKARRVSSDSTGGSLVLATNSSEASPVRAKYSEKEPKQVASKTKKNATLNHPKGSGKKALVPLSKKSVMTNTGSSAKGKGNRPPPAPTSTKKSKSSKETSRSSDGSKKKSLNASKKSLNASKKSGSSLKHAKTFKDDKTFKRKASDSSKPRRKKARKSNDIMGMTKSKSVSGFQDVDFRF